MVREGCGCYHGVQCEDEKVWCVKAVGVIMECNVKMRRCGV